MSLLFRVLTALFVLCFHLYAEGNEEYLSAGSMSTKANDVQAFSLPFHELTPKQLREFAKGKEQFLEPWVVAPDPNGVWGLGPTFNEARCEQCHTRNGRSKGPQHQEPLTEGLLVRLSVGRDENGAPKGSPNYGTQLQNRGTDTRVPPEGQAIISFSDTPFFFADGERLLLRKPRLHFSDLQFYTVAEPPLLYLAPQMVGKNGSLSLRTQCLRQS